MSIDHILDWEAAEASHVLAGSECNMLNTMMDDDGDDDDLSKLNGRSDNDVVVCHVLSYNAAEAVGQLLEGVHGMFDDMMTDLHAAVIACVASDELYNVGDLVTKLVMAAVSGNGTMFSLLHDGASAFCCQDDVMLMGKLVGKLDEVRMMFTKATLLTDDAVLSISK